MLIKINKKKQQYYNITHMIHNMDIIYLLVVKNPKIKIYWINFNLIKKLVIKIGRKTGN
jgi:hypothetical protein